MAGPHDMPAASTGQSHRLRPYGLTGGRTRPAVTLHMDTLLSARPEAASVDLGLDGERIRLLCASPTSVAQLAAQLEQPVSVAKILAGDLLSLNALGIAQPPETVSAGPDRDLLEAVLGGLQRVL